MRILMPFAAFAVIVVAAAGCGGGDTLTIEEYLEEFADARAEFVDVRADLREDADLQDVFTDEDISRQDRELIEEGYDTVIESVEEFESTLDGLGAPDEVQAVHDDYLALAAEYRDVWEGALEDLPDAETTDDFAGVASDIDDLDEQERGLCDELTEIAEDEDVDVDLECEPPQLSLADYFAEVETLAIDADRSTDLFDDLSESIADADAFDDAFAADTAELLEEIQSVFVAYGDGLEALNPPDEVESANAAAASAYSDVAAALGEAADATREGNSFEDLAAAFEGLDAPAEAADDACFALQRLADDNDIFVDLRCAVDDVTPPRSSLDEYFGEIASLSEEFDFAFSRTISIGGDAFTATGPLNDDQRAALIQGFTVLRDGADDLRVALQGITPPPEAAFSHQLYIDSARDSSSLITTAIDQLATAQTSDDRDRILDPVVVPTCGGLLQAAEDNAITVDLPCATE